jgi:hypothetical protein
MKGADNGRCIVTTLRFPDEVPVSGDVLRRIAATLGIPVAHVVVDPDDVPVGKSGWDYDRVEQIDDRRLLDDGITGYALGSRWRIGVA